MITYIVTAASPSGEFMARNQVGINENIQDQTLYAAVDLGSNSFHMIITRCNNDQLTVIDRDRAVVRLAEGIKRGNGIEIKTQQCAFEALRHFRELRRSAFLRLKVIYLYCKLEAFALSRLSSFSGRLTLCFKREYNP